MSQNRPNARNASSVAPRIALPAQDEDVATLRRSIVAKLTYSVGRDPIVASERDWFIATALAVRDRMVERWVPATRAAYLQSRKRVYYLSLEFLIGRLLYDSLNNLSLVEPVRTALASWTSISTGCASWSRTLRWAMAAWAGWPPATWTAWRRFASPRTATASATTMACSAR